MKLSNILILAGLLTGTAATIAPAPAYAEGRFGDEDGKKKPKAKEEKKKKDDKGAAEKKDGPAALPKKVRLSPKGLRWGMNLKEVSSLYDAVFEKQFIPLYKRAEPGPRMAALDAELADQKLLVKRNLIEFGATPTGIDYTALKGEYSYRNEESMTHLVLRSGTKRHFFFIKNKLWKVYDEHKLKKKSKLGSTYKTAIERLTKKFKIAPRVREENAEEGPTFTTSDWTDGTTVIQALDRDETTIAIVYVDQDVLDDIAQYRTAEQTDSSAIDRDVEDVTSKKPEPPADDKKKKKKKKAAEEE